MSGPPQQCPHCGYELATYAEAQEALEAGAVCLLCGGRLERTALQTLVDSWTDEEILGEGARRADAEADFHQEEEDLFEGLPDFGDEGEEEDPLL
ncbi:MAG: hypothetical protein ACE5H3_09435 [Planctomycetota bacterium]